MRNLFLILSIVFVFTACDPCTECRPVYEATVDVKMMNITALNATQDSLEVVDTLIIVVRRLDVVNELIVSGSEEEGLADEKLELEAIIADKTHVGSVEEDLLKYLLDNRTELNAIIAAINAGNVRIEEIQLLTTGLNVFNEDSATNYALPLIDGADICSFLLIMNDEQYSLDIGYAIYTEQSFSTIYQVASGIEVVSHSFDSVNVACDTPECFNGETTITCYF